MALLQKNHLDRPSGLNFTMKTPSDFVKSDGGPTGFANPEPSVVLLSLSAPAAPVSLLIAHHPNLTTGPVRDRLVSLLAGESTRLLSIGPSYVGGVRKNHPAILATALHGEDEDELVLSIVALEDGNRFLTARVICPREFEPTFMPKLERCIHSFELIHHLGPTVKLEQDGPDYEIDLITRDPSPPPETQAAIHAKEVAKAREAALAKAAPLIAADRFNEAAQLVFAADDSAQGRAALSELFLQALREQVRRDGRRSTPSPRALELHARALQHRLSTYPDPHTEEEADRYGAGMDEDRAEIDAILRSPSP
ncbi:MAG: hypothetical protein HEQ23_06770 [Tepidisphaera sp.]